MINKEPRSVSRELRHKRVRTKISGTADRPRLCVFRSNKGIYVQVIDDVNGNTLVSASTLDKEGDSLIKQTHLKQNRYFFPNNN